MTEKRCKIGDVSRLLIVNRNNLSDWKFPDIQACYDLYKISLYFREHKILPIFLESKIKDCSSLEQIQKVVAEEMNWLLLFDDTSKEEVENILINSIREYLKC